MNTQRQLLLLLLFIFYPFYGASSPPIATELIGMRLNDMRTSEIASECPSGLSIAQSSSYEEFELLNESGELATISETDYDLVLDEIREFRGKVTIVGQSNRKRIELISILDSWKRNPENKFAIPWMEHSDTLILIIYLRHQNDFIPNSVLVDYLSFFAENIVIANARSSIFKQILGKAIEILRKMIRKAISAEIIRLYLDKIFPYMRQEHAFKIFHSCHWLLDYFGHEITGLSGPALKIRLDQVFRIYMIILRYFDLSLNDLKILIRQFRPQSATIPFIHLSIFYRHLLMLPTVNPDFTNSLPLKFHEPFLEYVKTLNFYFKESEFTNNFAVNAETILRKREAFQRIREIFFQQQELLSILIYCLDNKFKVVYEALLIYSEKNSELLETLLKVLKNFLVKRRKFEHINVYVSILAAWPEFTIELFDRFLGEFRETPGHKYIPLNDFMLKSFRRLIFVVSGSIDCTTVTWNPSEAFLEYLRDEEFDPKKGHLFHAGRIYLQVRYGIPLSLTAVSVLDSDEEEATWGEMIGFVNLILEREGRKAGSDHIPQIRTSYVGDEEL